MIDIKDIPHQFIRLSSYGLLKISGTDAKKLLQGQVTCDVNAVTATASQFGALCNPQGRVISLFGLFIWNDAYYLLMLRSMIPITLNTLKKYAVFYKATLTDASDEFAITGYIGNNAAKLAEEIDTAFYKIPRNDARIIIIGHTDLTKNAETATLDTWQQLDIAAGIPNIYPETSGKFLPHEINLHELGAINFNKGCYTGQEIIARMHYRGKLKNHLYQASVSSSQRPLPGADIYCVHNQQQEVKGMIVDSCPIAYNKYNVLMITDEANRKNHHLFIEPDQPAFLDINET